MKPDRTDTPLSPRFAKDSAREDWLERMNAALQGVEEASYRSDLEERWPTVHILGAPRSGTTLVSQLAASHLEVAWMSNLTAAFWAAPCLGARLAKHLTTDDFTSDFESEFGRTQGPAEPHEFGYFWSRLLGYEEMREPESDEVDWQRVRLVLTNLCAAFERPVLFKSYMLGYYLNAVRKALPKTCFVYVVRDPFENAASILGARREYTATLTDWIGVKPKEYEWLRERDVHTQVAGQVHFTANAIETRLREIPEANVLRIRYEDVCDRPGSILEGVSGLLRRHGYPNEIRGTPPLSFRRRSRASSDDLKRVREGFEALELS